MHFNVIEACLLLSKQLASREALNDYQFEPMWYPDSRALQTFDSTAASGVDITYTRLGPYLCSKKWGWGWGWGWKQVRCSICYYFEILLYPSRNSGGEKKDTKIH